MTNTPLKTIALPRGWLRGKTSGCVIYRPLEQFTYAEVRYEPDKHTHRDYVLYLVDVEGPGPQVETRRGSFTDLGKAIQAGDTL